ncbi:diguanylate cyclase [Bremerella sp. JC817]|uniref:diguanylate cyclase domain-containing protein n=1 Tax=Bremerella sp. JC817 TaxID=3231756 RepID=UPI003459941D
MSEFTLLHLLLCLIFFKIGYVAATWLRYPAAKQKQATLVNDQERKVVQLPESPVTPDSTAVTTVAAEDLSDVVDEVRDLAKGMRTDVQAHSQSVEQINHDLVSMTNMSDPDAVTRVISRLMEANRHLDSRLNVAEARLQEQSQLLRSHRVEARTDALTGLPNRRVFDEEIARLFNEKRESKRPASLIMIDIDHFKTFNDRNGHQAGDYCLQKVGEVIRSAVKGVGGIAMRYGGEEFAVLLPATELFDAKLTARRINSHIERLPLEFEGRPLKVTASLGIAEIVRDSEPAEWLGRADRALYASKRRGRNRACWHDGKTCHEVPHRKADPAVEASEESSAIGRRDAFMLDVSRRLALFHRKRQPLAMILASVDSVDGKPLDSHHDSKKIQSAVLQVFQAILRDMDHICQMGDNQFGAMLPSATGEEASAVAERARQAIGRLELQTATDTIKLTISCGVSQALEGDEAQHMVARCEAGLKHAQDKSGNSVYLVRNECDWEAPRRMTREAVIAS